MKMIVSSLISFVDNLSKIGVNKTDGSNQAVMEIRNRVLKLGKACDEAEKIIQIVMPKMTLFNKKEQMLLKRHIEKFNLYD